MSRFDFTLDLAVATGYLAADKERAAPIQVAVLVMLGPDGTVCWEGAPDYVYPLRPDALSQVADDVGQLYQTAVQYWPALAGACDWWTPDPKVIDQQKFLGQQDGNVIGLQQL